MNSMKSTLLLIGMVLLGFVAGFGTHLLLVKKRVETVKQMRYPGGIQERVFHMLQVDEAQRQKLEPIMTKRLEEFDLIMKETRDKRRSIIDSMKSEMRPFLSEPQVEKLDEALRRLRHGGPPPHRNPNKK